MEEPTSIEPTSQKSSSFPCLPSWLNSFETLALQHGFSGETLITTPSGPVTFWIREQQSGSRTSEWIYISAGMHGDEPSGCHALLNWLRQGPPPHLNLILAPVLNPTGLTLGTRENHNGVDLNRDFLKLQTREIRAFIRWWNQNPRHCSLHLSLHEDWEAAGFYLYKINTAAPWSPEHEILEQVSRHYPLQPMGSVDGHELSAPGLIDHPPIPDEREGWPEAIWLAKRYPTLSLTFEAPGTQPLANRIAMMELAIAAAVAEFDRHFG
jgi:murein peptide amidase A